MKVLYIIVAVLVFVLVRIFYRSYKEQQKKTNYRKYDAANRAANIQKANELAEDRRRKESLPTTVTPLPAMVNTVWVMGSQSISCRDLEQGKYRWVGYSPQSALSDPHSHGVPGSGLDSSGMAQGRIDAGKAGEETMANIFESFGLTRSNGELFWSLRVPDNRYNSDVDCIFTYGNKVFLIDAKNYKYWAMASYRRSNGDDWESTIVAVNSNNVPLPNSSHTLSKSMRLAYDKFKDVLPRDVAVIPIIALCPNRAGLTGIQPMTCVYNVPIVSAVQLADALRKESQGQPARPDVVSIIETYVQ